MIDETLRQAYRQGVPVQLIYLDQKGRISERCVRLYALQREEISAYCFSRRSYRRFKRERVLAAELRHHFFQWGMQPEKGNASTDPGIPPIG
ncbi:hypothetical protein [Desmospora profundinema]|uniref:DNA-binding transcriptional regulator YafY n=1 Tax=Desmospora profundinema TaxID=1571184 RepID=A0ABU1IHB9_9BACL|nr:hypothetical protein [Desmospora profundinema]MDR6224177.1 putative DNA-binding transcriptional regulator YafY [Desmospora profundinema]